MNATFSQTTDSGLKIRMCMHCMLHVTESGHPNPDWYSDEFLVAYYRTPIDQRCKHDKAKPKLVASAREIELEEMLRYIRNILNRVLEKK